MCFDFSPTFIHGSVKTLACVFPFIGVGVSFFAAANLVRTESPITAIAIGVGALASATTFCYPMHLMYDQHWLDCILTERYEAEDIALTAYVYLPATLCFSLILFGGTLFQRRIVTDLVLGVFIVVVALVNVVFTGLLLAEVQLPGICGLQIYMPCPAPETGTLSWRIETALDPRPSFQSMLSHPVMEKLVELLGAVPISDHTSYRNTNMIG